MKKLYRSNINKVFGGVLGGLGEYLDIDPVFLRLIFVVIMIFTAIVPCVIIYLLALIIIPKKNRQ